MALKKHAATNPATCLHNILQAGLDDNFMVTVWCASCGSDMTAEEKRVDKNYLYDIDYNVWVHTPVKKEKI